MLTLSYNYIFYFLHDSDSDNLTMMPVPHIPDPVVRDGKLTGKAVI